MLIRNIKSHSELQKARQLQAQILQIQIDNESVLEGRVSNYKNPNRPPPVPPQYKTNAEVQQDSLIQRKQTIENLLSLGIEYPSATSVQQQLGQLPDGEANFLKFNRNFPAIKREIEERFNPKQLSSDVLMTFIQEYLTELDTNLLLGVAGVNSTSLFPKSVGGATELATGSGVNIYADLQAGQPIQEPSIYSELLSILFAISQLGQLAIAGNNANFDDIVLSSADVALYSLTPSQEADIDLLPVTERNRLYKDADRLVSFYKIPKYDVIDALAGSLRKLLPTLIQIDDDLANQRQPVSAIPTDFDRALLSGRNIFASVKGNAAIQALRDFNDKVVRLTAGVQGVQGQAQGQLAAGQAAQAQLALLLQRDKDATRAKLQAFTATGTSADYVTRLEALGLLNRGMPYWLDAPQNGNQRELYDYMYKVGAPDVPVDAAGNPSNARGYISQPSGPPKLATNAELQFIAGGGYNQGNIQDWLNQFEEKRTIKITAGGRKGLNGPEQRYSRAELLQMLNPDLTIVADALANDPNYNPERDPQQRIVQTQGFGIPRNEIIRTAVYRPEEDYKVLGRGKKPDAIHIDINSHNGENYKMSGDGFMSKKIKVGRGIDIQQEPTYRTFGKYIIHMPHLEKGVLNVKYPSTGGIPTIKPVNIEDNFKEFIFDVIENGKVNQSHFKSLTQPERNHFSKVVSGAGLSRVLNIKPEDDKADVKRLEILYGEIMAGNDNEKIYKECKELIKRCVNTGAITKMKGMDYLLDIN
jgi:hypothetical protein